MKKTIEEVAERLVKETTLYGSQEASIGSSARSYFETELQCVLLGMKWQQEQDKKMYSELVDLLERLTTIYKEDCHLDIKYDKKRLEFIEQFKNK